MVNGITFSEQMITSANFAHFMYTFLSRTNGVTKGCEVSHADGTVYIQSGYFMDFGRMVQIIGTEEVASPDVMSGQLYCRVVFEIDLTKTNTVDSFNQGYFKVLTGAGAYPELTQEDLDGGGTLYQMPWCRYIKDMTGIIDFVDEREILDMISIWNKELDNYATNEKVDSLETKVDKFHMQRKIALSTSGWSSTYPYTKTVSVSGITAADNLKIIGVVHADGNTEAQDKAIDKAAGYLMYNESGTGAGTITFKAKKVPEVAIIVIVEGG